MPRPCDHARRSPSSSSFTPLSATALILTARPAFCAASMPASTLSSSPQRVIARNLSGSSVSSDTLMRFTPQSASSARIFRKLRAVGGERQLIQPIAEMARERLHERHDAAPHQRLAAGEPQLAHAARNERAAQPVQFLERQQVGLRQERHVFRHAVDAAEIAAVGHRHAQIGDRPLERIDQRSRLDGCGAFEAHMFPAPCGVLEPSVPARYGKLFNMI